MKHYHDDDTQTKQEEVKQEKVARASTKRAHATYAHTKCVELHQPKDSESKRMRKIITGNVNDQAQKLKKRLQISSAQT